MRPLSFSLFSPLAGFLIVAGIGFPGCRPEEGVRQYTVAKSAPHREAITAPAHDENSAWFLKLTGPADLVLQQVVPFATFVRTLKFTADGTPQYELPEGWKKSAGPPPRYETIAISDTDPPLEVSISSLPFSASDPEEYLRANFNRWRGQLGMAPLEGANWLEEATSRNELLTVPTGTLTVTMVNLTGATKEFGKSRILGAIVLPPGGAATDSGNSPPKSASPAAPLSYELPEGWTRSAGNAMRLVSLEATTASGKVDISVTLLPGGGDLLSNVNRWRQQVKLDPVEEAELKKSLEELAVDGRKSSYMLVAGSEQAILAAIVPEGDAKWFFKMQGPKQAVEAEQDHFRQFLQSVKFNNTQQ